MEHQSGSQRQGPGLLHMLMLAANGFVVSAVVRVIDTLIPPIAAEFQTSLAGVSIIVAGFAIGFGATTLIHGSLGDQFGKLQIICIGSVIAGVATYFCGETASLNQLAFLRFLTGAFISACVALSIAYIADHVAYGQRQAAIGQYLTGIMMGTFLGAAFAGLLIDWAGWRFVFKIYGVFLILSGIAIAIIIFTDTSESTTRMRHKLSLQSYISIFKLPAANRIWFISLSEGIAFFGCVAFIGALFQYRFQLSFFAIGLLLGCFGIGGLLYTMLVKFLIRKLSEMHFVLIGGLSVASVMASLAFIESQSFLLLHMIILGFGFYMFHNTLQTKASEVAPHTRGIALALFSMSIFIGQSLGAFMFGYLIDLLGFSIAFSMSSLLFAALSLWFAYQIPSGVLGSKPRR